VQLISDKRVVVFSPVAFGSKSVTWL